MRRTPTTRRTRATRRALALLLAFALTALAPQRGAGARAAQAGDDHSHLELPAGGEVKVENTLGGVSVETWAENFVEVASASDGAPAAGDASPVRVERTPSLLSITVARAAVAPSARRATNARGASRAGGAQGAERARAPRVDLTLRVPAGARLTIFTSAGSIEVRGRTARLDAQTVSGDLLLELPRRPDADVMARTLRGTITVRAGAAGAPEERVLRERFQARLGAGRSVVRLASASGHIVLGSLGERAQARSESPRETSRPAPRETPGAAVRGDEIRRDEDESARDSARSRAARAGDTQRDSAGESSAARRRPPVLAGQRGDEGRATTDAQSPPAGEVRPRPSLIAPSRTPPGEPSLNVPRAGSQGQPPAPSRPSPDAPIEVDADEVITVDTHVVTLNLSVVNRTSGRGLAGLAQGDFRVFEDGVEQQITHFESASAPFDLLLVVDLSGSTAKVKDVIRAACLRFVESVRPRDRVGVVAFAGTHAVVSPLTEDKRELRARLERMATPAGDTKLYDALNFSLDYVEAQSPKSRRRAVVLLSDGLDSALPNVQGEGSALAYDDLRRRVQEFDGLLYTVWTDTSYEALSPLDIQPETFDLVYERMEELAAQGGGVFYEVEKLEDLGGVYGRVVADLGTVYTLAYLPANRARDGRWRAVRVRLPGRPEAVARGRSGYYAK